MNLLPDDPSDLVQQRAIALIRPLIPADAEKRVAQAVRQFNAIVREHIRLETGLRLSDEKIKGSVPVKVVDGFPDAVAQLIGAHQDLTLWRLILATAKLDGVVEGLGLLLQDWDEFERWLELPVVARGSRPALQKAMEVAQALKAFGATKKVFDDLRGIQEDILGVYRFSGWEGPHVELFWMAHALFAGAFGVRIEDLAVVTLSHELAHAYTHLGRDIDGATWREPGFSESAREVVEGLAQFYTAVVTQKLWARASGAFAAYQKMLAHQSGPYRAHERWLEHLTDRRGETIRFAMLRARVQGKVSAPEWEAILEETRRSLRPSA